MLKGISLILGTAAPALLISRTLRSQEDEKSENLDESVSSILRNRPPGTPQAIRQQWIVQMKERCPEELDQIMGPVRSLTQLEPIDGLKLGLSFQPQPMFRVSSGWNYANIGKSGFNVCGAWLNQGGDVEETYYRDMAAAEYSGDKGVTLLGSYVPIPKWGVMFKGDCRVANAKTFANPQYMLEVCKVLDSVQVGLFKKHDAFGLSFLHRYSGLLSYAGQLEFFNDFKKPGGAVGIALNRDQHRFSAVYNARDKHSINTGYLYEFSSRLAFASEHVFRLATKESDAILGFKARFASGEVKCNISSSMRATTEISHVVDTMILLRAYGQVDFWKESPAVFGISFDLGSLTLQSP